MEHQSHFLLPFVESFSFLMPSPLWLHNAVRLVNPKNLIMACHSSWLDGCLVKIEGLLHNDLLVWWLVDRGLCLSTLWSHDSLLWQQITTWSLQLSYKAWRALCCYPGWSYLSGNSEEYAVSKKWIRRKKELSSSPSEGKLRHSLLVACVSGSVSSQLLTTAHSSQFVTQKKLKGN